jgi:hypothetical protein
VVAEVLVAGEVADLGAAGDEALVPLREVLRVDGVRVEGR